MPVSSRHNSSVNIDKPLNPGDRVRVKSKEWYDSMPKDSNGTVSGEYLDGTYSFSKDMTKLCGKKFIVCYANKISWYIGNPKVVDPIAYNLSDMELQSTGKRTNSAAGYSFTISMLELCQ